nr:MAG TPA: hypothetical protein [Caudoviricetes sp.]
MNPPPILFWEINNLFILCCYKISSFTYRTFNRRHNSLIYITASCASPFLIRHRYITHYQ